MTQKSGIVSATGTGYWHRARLAELIDLPVTADPTTRS